MPAEKTKLLIIDDERTTRTLLSHILIKLGYSVRSAEDGFSALSKLREETPDIIISDLNMPGMSGFELLSVIRRRFPAIKVIAMSGYFSGDAVQPGVAADAFYEKATHVGSLLQTVEAISRLDRPLRHSNASTPMWIPKNGSDSSGVEYVTLTCQECLRTSPQVLGEDISLIQETRCVHCNSLIYYAIVQPTDPSSPQAFQRKQLTAMPAFFGGS